MIPTWEADATALLEIRDVHAGYGETEILHGVSADVGQGEIVVIIGPNGAGKSTLIRAVIGILKPTSGSIRFAGAEITGWNPEDLVVQGLAYVPQNRNVFPRLTVRENLEVAAVSRNPGWMHKVYLRIGRALRANRASEATVFLTPEQFDERIDRIVEIFPNLRTKLRQPVSTLSGGEQQMVALGRGLILDPRLILVDEPSAGMAPKLVTMIFQKIAEINQYGTAILLVEQNAKRALAMAHRGYVLEMGRNRYEGKGEALLSDPEVGRLYLGG
ncbi:MAG TPA: ABC transporter ATP-binding protein [Thermoplasmata archaeon]|nr:ABC transporter ATP-binding protein [Thermoplasmata archaeon]